MYELKKNWKGKSVETGPSSYEKRIYRAAVSQGLRNSAKTNTNGSRTMFVIAYIEIYVFKGNPFQTHGLQQSYHPTQHLNRKNIIQNKKCKCKNNIKLS